MAKMATLKGIEYPEMLRFILQTAEQRFSNNGNGNNSGNGNNGNGYGNGHDLQEGSDNKFNWIELNQESI
jgi:hypothetical protein